MDDPETLSAYHESGHAVIGHALGASIECVRLGGEADDYLPERFGECRVRWAVVDGRASSQGQRELLAILAGPIAEMLYRGKDFLDDLDLANPKQRAELLGPWQADWALATRIANRLAGDPIAAGELIRKAIERLVRVLDGTECWAAVAALADELEAHGEVEAEQIEAIVGFWLRRSTQ